MSRGNREKTQAAERLADRWEAERGHREQVRRLSIQLFDCLQDFLKLEEPDRVVLECAAIVHDIGWCTGKQGHHKQSMKLILEDTCLPVTEEERIQIALTARYHRKALPNQDHPIYGTLGAEEQKRIDALAGLLRIADCLDSRHQNRVENIRTEFDKNHLRIWCRCPADAQEELQAARKKADLLERVLGGRIEIVCELSKADFY